MQHIHRAIGSSVLDTLEQLSNDTIESKLHEIEQTCGKLRAVAVQANAHAVTALAGVVASHEHTAPHGRFLDIMQSRAHYGALCNLEASSSSSHVPAAGARVLLLYG